MPRKTSKSKKSKPKNPPKRIQGGALDENGFHDIGSPDFSTDIKDGLKNKKVIVSVCGGLETTSEKLFEADTKVVATSKQLYDYTEKLRPRETQITIEEVSRLRSVENSNYFKELSDLGILLIYYPKKVTFNSKDNYWYRTSVIEDIVQWTYDAKNDTYVKILQKKLGNDNFVINNDKTNTIYQIKLDFDKALFSDEEAYYNLLHAIENESYQTFYNNAILFPTKEDKELLQKYEKDLVKAKQHRKETKLLLSSRFHELEKAKEKRHREKHEKEARDRENALRAEKAAAAALEQAKIETKRAEVAARRLVTQNAEELQQAQRNFQESQDRQLTLIEAENARIALEQQTEQSEIAIRAAEAANAAKAAQQEADAANARERAAYEAEKEAKRVRELAEAKANAPPSNGVLEAITGAVSSLLQGSPQSQLQAAKQNEISAEETANRATEQRIAAEKQALKAASNAQEAVARAQASAPPQTLKAVPVATTSPTKTLKLPPMPKKQSTRKRTYSKTYSKTRKAHTRSHTRSHPRAHARKRSVSRKRSPSPSRKSKYKSKSRKRVMSKRKRSPTHLKGRTSPQRHSPLVPPPVRPRA